MSDTPRTDYNELAWAHEYSRSMEFGWPSISGVVDSDCARILERELNAMTEERDELREEVNSLKESIRDQEHHIMELERLRRYSPGPHMGQD